MELYNAAISVLPITYPAYYAAGFVYQEHEKDPEKALRIYTELMKYAPDFAQVHYQTGLALRTLGKYSDALRELTQSKELNPYHKGVQFNLAMSSFENGELKRAEAEFKTALKLRTDDEQMELEYDLAITERLLVIYHNRKEWTNALEQGQTLIELDPRNAAVHSNMGSIFTQMGNKTDGLKHFQKAIQLNPDFLAGYQNLLLFYTTEGLTQQAEELRGTMKRRFPAGPK